MTKTQLIKPFKSKLFPIIIAALLISLTVPSALPDKDIADESNLAIELKKEVYKTHAFQLKVYVLTNPESKLQDIYIMPDGEQDYDTETFSNAIISAINKLSRNQFHT